MNKIIFFTLVFPIFLSGQTSELKKGNSSIPFDNYKFFQANKPKSWKDFSSYPETWDGKQFMAWGLLFVSGISSGIREAYHADPYIFEKRWGVGENSFWGSDAWERNYNADGSHKSELFGNVGRDVWHTFGFVQKTTLISGSFTIGARKNQPIKYRLINLLIGFGIQSASASITYQVLRR